MLYAVDYCNNFAVWIFYAYEVVGDIIMNKSFTRPKRRFDITIHLADNTTTLDLMLLWCIGNKEFLYIIDDSWNYNECSKVIIKDNRVYFTHCIDVPEGIWNEGDSVPYQIIKAVNEFENKLDNILLE